MDNPEIVLNLWYVVDEGSGFIYSLAGRAYALTGSEEEKLRVLKILSKTDYLAAKRFPVPNQFEVEDEEDIMEGVCTVEVLREQHADVYADVFEQLQKDLPEFASFAGGEVRKIQLHIPESPLCVTTALFEVADGVIIARA